MAAPPEPGASEGPVVVGVDGSDSSRAALRWAARHAERTGQGLHVVLAWHLPADYGWPLPLPSDWRPEEDARIVLEEEVADVLGPGPHPGVTMTTRQGPAAQVLIDASRTASMVVVASRGRGQLAGVLLGSVSEYLAAHAHCPVVVVHAGKTAATPTSPARHKVLARSSTSHAAPRAG